MKSLVMLLLLVCTAWGQDTPRFEVFTGFNWERNDLDMNRNTYGWRGSVSEYLNSWFGGTADFSGNYSEPGTPTILTDLGAPEHMVNINRYTFLFGPTIRYPKPSRLTPYGSFLVGAVNERVSTTSAGTAATGGTQLSDSETVLGWAAGGGVDYRLTKRLSVRGQVDFLRSYFDDFEDDRQHSVRTFVGIVWRFGTAGVD